MTFRNSLLGRATFLAACFVISFGTITLGQRATAPDPELVETQMSIPVLKPAADYKPRDNTIEIELSEYAGYSGLIVANGGLSPNAESSFFKKHGFNVKITLSEEESWSALNSGKMAASATTVDVLAAYGNQFHVVVPALIGFSRGADGVVVRKEIKQINNLRGKILATSQFTEADFFIRYLAQEAGLQIKMLSGLSDAPDPQMVNLVFCSDAFAAGDLFLRDIKSGQHRLAGCVTWAPKTTEIAENSQGAAHVLITNTNLLIVADVFIMNGGFAKANPSIVKGLVEGMLEGNALIRSAPEKYLPIIAKAFKWDSDDAKVQLAKVHLANLPENLAFFNGTIDSAGSYGYIFETATYVYGSGLIKKSTDSDHFLALSSLDAINKSGMYKNQKASIAPIRSDEIAEAESPLLSKNISFEFTPNQTALDLKNERNKTGLESIAKLLTVSPGSTVTLRGHSDGSQIEEFRAGGGEAAARKLILRLKGISKDRCMEIKRLLVANHNIDETRVKIEGVGADEPTGKGPDHDRRVETLWFTAN